MPTTKYPLPVVESMDVSVFVVISVYFSSELKLPITLISSALSRMVSSIFVSLSFSTVKNETLLMTLPFARRLPVVSM